MENTTSQVTTSQTSGLAIASLVCGIISLSTSFCLTIFVSPLILAAIICGHMALNKIKASNGAIGGRGMAIAGLVTGYLALLAAAVMLALAIAVNSGAIEIPQQQ